MKKGYDLPWKKIHILHTNDLHSCFVQMPQVASCIKTLKQRYEEKGENVIVMDIGDHADRMSLKTEATWGRANIDVLNETGYEYMCLGNNEGLTFPKEILNRFFDEARFQVLTANFFDLETGRPSWLKPYTIHELDGVRIGLIAITAPFETFYRLLGWDVASPQARMEQALQDLRNQTDINILMSHIGYPLDIELAQETDDIDLILGAHTHHFLPYGEEVNGTLITQTGKMGGYVGHVEIEWDDHKNKRIKSECVPVETFKEDPGVAALIQSHTDAAERIMSTEVCALDAPFPVSWEEEYALANLLAQGIRDWVDADCAMVNGGLLLYDLPEGPVNKKQLLECCPHPINPCSVEMSGKDIRSILEDALQHERIVRKLMGFGFRGKMLGWLHVDRMEILYDADSYNDHRIRNVYIDGVPLDLNRTYKVGTVDMFTFGHVFPQFKKANHVEFYVPEFIREILEKELKHPAAIRKSRVKRWLPVEI